MFFFESVAAGEADGSARGQRSEAPAAASLAHAGTSQNLEEGTEWDRSVELTFCVGNSSSGGSLYHKAVGVGRPQAALRKERAFFPFVFSSVRTAFSEAQPAVALPADSVLRPGGGSCSRLLSPAFLAPPIWLPGGLLYGCN